MKLKGEGREVVVTMEVLNEIGVDLETYMESLGPAEWMAVSGFRKGRFPCFCTVICSIFCTDPLTRTPSCFVLPFCCLGDDGKEAFMQHTQKISPGQWNSKTSTALEPKTFLNPFSFSVSLLTPHPPAILFHFYELSPIDFPLAISI